MVAESDRKIKTRGVWVPAGGPPEVARAWASRSDELAAWTWTRLVNRRDVYGAYTPRGRRGQEYVRADGTVGKVPASYTAPAGARRGRALLTKDLLARHYRGLAVEDVLGLHTTSPGNTSLWGAVEVDWHGPASTAPEVNLAAALAWYDHLRRRGFTPLLNESNGKGGYHLRALFGEPVPTPLVYAFLHRLVADHPAHGLPNRPETFPKQPRIDPGRFGNWLRLPGRHHTREHWSRVWGGGRWLGGHEAVNHILALRGDDPGLLAEGPGPLTVPPVGRSRFVRAGGSGGSGGVERRVSAYMSHLPNLGEGQGRDDVAYSFACFLARDLQLSDPDALAWLGQWDAGNRPPKGPERLAQVLADAHKYGRRPYGSGLGIAGAARRPGQTTPEVP
jgi:hypothetical protein